MTTALERAMSEENLLVYVTDLLGWGHWRWTHIRRSDRAQTMGDKGIPDIVAVRGSRLLYIELKRENGKVSADQSAWLDALEIAGAEVHVWRPSDMERMKVVLA